MTERGQSRPEPTYGRYRLLEPIGRGGMAEVFKAKSFGVEGFEKVLVIKRILPELAAHPAFVDMFVAEAKLAVRLSHANIVQVFDLGRIEGAAGPSYYIAMEYVPGVDLATLLAHCRRVREPLPPALAVFVASEVGKALDHAHRRRDEHHQPLGIVHRDISPQNILLSWEGDVKVTDFGIAKARDIIPVDEAASDDTTAVRAAGKLSYLSPEQLRGEPTDARSDLFALGVVLYEMLTSANPFRAAARAETARRVLACEYPPLELGCPGVPRALADLVARLLTPRPEARLASAGELCEQLLEHCYVSGQRWGASELCDVLAPLRDAGEAPALEGTRVRDEPSTSEEPTPVEIPRGSGPPPEARDGLAPRGERRDVSAVVVAFPARESDVARARMRQLLERHGAWIHEETGSQLVAIFGLGDTDGRDAEAAVRAALVLVRSRGAGVVPAAGVHCGAISVDMGGIPIADERLAALVATAQSLARAAEGSVALSPITGRLVRRTFVTEALPDARRLVDGAVVVKSAQPSDRPRVRFVGRHDELKRLGAIMAAATRQVPQLAVVRGETGIGKSRFLLEARRRLERGQFNVAFYTASCPLNGATVPWSALRAMLHVLCGTEEDDDPGRILEVAPRLRALGLPEAEVAAILHLLGAPTRTAAGETSAAIRSGFERMVFSLCRDRLHCFAWDDAQAADFESLAAIARIFGRASPPSSAPGATSPPSAGVRAVFILAQRGEVPAVLASLPGVHDLELGELGERETAKLLEVQLDQRSVPPGVLGYVRNYAGGHPLFVEELLREIAENGELGALGGAALAAPPELSTAAPRTLKNLVASRVSRLPERERRVLQGIAILGEPALTPVLAATVKRSLPALDQIIAALGQKGLVRRTAPTKVRFASPLYREIVLAAMAPVARQELHATAAHVYMQARYGEGGAGRDATFVGPSGETLERIAEHLFDAGDRRLASQYFWQAAEEKLGVGQLEAALRTMQRTLELADLRDRSVEELCNWLVQLAEAATRVRAAPGLKDAVLPALRQIQARGEPRLRARAGIAAAGALGAINQFDDAYRVLEEARADTGGEVGLERAALRTEIEVSLRKGLFTQGAAAADRLEALGPAEDVATLLLLSQVRASTGRCERALEHMDRADALGRSGDPVEAVARQKHRALIYFNLRDFQAVARETSKLADLARSAGLRYEAAAALHNLGDACDRLGDMGRAYAAFVESFEFAKALDHERLSNLNQMHLCALEALKGHSGAEDLLKALIRQADGSGFLWDVLEGRFLLARVLHASGRSEQARPLLVRVQEMAAEHGHELIYQDAREMLAQL
ncbi:MAG: protein kinase [Myxococcales bacterium]|nr:protein kinase [Myxococcales bacterium]